jgi:hypothetical protein
MGVKKDLTPVGNGLWIASRNGMEIMSEYVCNNLHCSQHGKIVVGKDYESYLRYIQAMEKDPRWFDCAVCREPMILHKR